MRTVIAIAIICITAASALRAQTSEEKERARRIALDGIALVDKGELDKGLEMLREAEGIDSSVSDYRYEQGYVYAMKNDYETARKIVEPLIAKPDATDRYYELLGNCYDYFKNPEKAIKTYYAGLKRFPNSGVLHLELGVMAMGQKDYDKAVKIWEEGIDRDPMHSSNYYWAAKFLCNSDHKLWGVIYAEIFLNLEPGTKRSKEISKLLYTTYKKSITMGRDSTRIDFEPGIFVRVGKDGKPIMPLIASYSTVFLVSMTPQLIAAGTSDTNDSELSIATLHDIRQAFINNWFKMKQDKDFPSVLFDWQRKLIETGHGEAYDYWLLSYGNPDEFIAWRDAHKDAMDAMIEYVNTNHLKIERGNAFDRPRVDHFDE